MLQVLFNTYFILSSYYRLLIPYIIVNNNSNITVHILKQSVQPFSRSFAALKASFERTSSPRLQYSSVRDHRNSTTTGGAAGRFQADSTWSQLINKLLDLPRFAEEKYAEHLRGLDFWKLYDVCSLYTHSSAFASGTLQQAGTSVKVVSFYDAFTYATGKKDIFNVTGQYICRHD